MALPGIALRPLRPFGRPQGAGRQGRMPEGTSVQARHPRSRWAADESSTHEVEKARPSKKERALTDVEWRNTSSATPRVYPGVETWPLRSLGFASGCSPAPHLRCAAGAGVARGAGGRLPLRIPLLSGRRITLTRRAVSRRRNEPSPMSNGDLLLPQHLAPTSGSRSSHREGGAGGRLSSPRRPPRVAPRSEAEGLEGGTTGGLREGGDYRGLRTG
jgi:hypothetical protein